MSKVLAEIRAHVGDGSLSDSCRRNGCRVFMQDAPSPRVLVDADLAFPAHEMEGKRCDFVLFFTGTNKDTLFAVPMELKRGGVDASEVSAQLQRGADFAHRFSPQGFKAVCHPVLFHGGSIHPKQRRTLNRAKVHFRGLPLTIKTARCNRPGNLALALEGAGQ